MSDYDNTNRGILSRNERRQNDNHPEYSGSINIEGTEYWLSGWVKERKDGGGRFFSLSVKRKDASQSAKKKQSSDAGFDPNDPIPF